MNFQCQKLHEVLQNTRALVARPENDFSWSSWKDAEDALSEIDTLIAKTEAGKMPKWAEIAVLYAGTGPIQEISISSGWGEEFLIVAAQFDDVFNRT